MILSVTIIFLTQHTRSLTTLKQKLTALYKRIREQAIPRILKCLIANMIQFTTNWHATPRITASIQHDSAHDSAGITHK